LRVLPKSNALSGHEGMELRPQHLVCAAASLAF
jgi:hypothetical protein